MTPPRPPLAALPDDATAEAFRPWRSRSYLTAVSIIRSNERDVLEGRHLEFNEMLGCVTLGRSPLRDSDVHHIRELIEARFVGGLDKNNNEVGLQISVADAFAAVDQVASSASFHPVAEYLRGLRWDCEKRIEGVVKLLGAPDTKLNQAIIKRWFIATVARPLQPGCKQDVMLVLVGPQGALKSSAFRVLAGEEWFADTAVDIHSKDAFLTLRRAWILEWAELESLQRARDAGAVKAFLTSAVDVYRPSYGRLDQRVPRSGVIVGSTNNVEFLADETGSRRFWPLTVGKIDLEKLGGLRDQLWAEAVALYDADEKWWLTPEEEALLLPVHEDYAVPDVWAQSVLAWMETGTLRTTAEILTHVLEMKIGDWSRADEMRVSKILRRAGWVTSRPDRNGPRVWVRK